MNPYAIVFGPKEQVIVGVIFILYDRKARLLNLVYSLKP